MEQDAHPASEGLDAIRARVVDAMLAATVVLAAPAWVLSMLASIRAGITLISWATSLAYALILFVRFAPGLSTRTKALSLIAVMQFVSLSLLLGLGPGGPGVMWLAAATITAAALRGSRAARITFASHIAYLIAVTYLFIAFPNPAYTFPFNGVGWVATASGSVLLGGALAVAVGRLVSDLGRAIDGLSVEQTRLEEETARRALLEAELERRVADRTAALAAVNADLERFARTVSHDLRTPLQVIAGSAELMGLRVPVSDAAQTAHLQRIQGAVSRAAETINALLRLAQASGAPLRREPVDLGSLARGLLDDLALADPGHRVELVLMGELVVTADQALLNLALQNLLSNCWKFTSRNANARVEFGRVAGAGEPVYFMRDNGVGFDPASADRLFHDFVRLHGEGEFPGSGLGLATVARVVARHGGRVWAEGAPGAGATVSFTLPA